MRVAISGATGFVGSHLSEYLKQNGVECVAIGRAELSCGRRDDLVRIVDSCDAAINLAGASISHRWSTEYKSEILSSRVNSTRRLVDAINSSDRCQRLISTSAVGLYPCDGCHDELQERVGDSFLARVCQEWESEARRVNCSLAITRFGVVLSDAGGALLRVLKMARWGVVATPAPLAHLSWIDLRDLMRIELILLQDSSLQGLFNLTAPVGCTMGEMCRVVAKQCGAKINIPLPEWLLRTVQGELSQVITCGVCATPQRLLEEGYKFISPSIQSIFEH